MPCRWAIPLFAAFLGFSLPAKTLRDIDGNEHPLPSAPGAKATVVFFVTNDCPISNRYVPEIGRICRKYASDGARCLMAYVDPTVSDDEIRGHRREYGSPAPAVQDTGRDLIEMAGATITPEAAVFDAAGQLAYRGRIDNLYAALGTPRRQATEHDLRKALKEVLAGAPVTRPRTQAVGCFIPDWAAIRQGDSP